VTAPTGNRAAPGICVLGLGLIGGSLLRALDRAGRPAFGWNRSSATVDTAAAAGHDADTDLTAVLTRAAQQDALIVVATPTPTVGEILAQVARHAPGCALTDVVSVKQAVADAVAEHGLSARYVGGHPMAGTSRSGWDATDPDLFVDAPWVVCADDDTDPMVWSTVADVALAVGARVVPVATEDHDPLVAAISHVPHLTAAVTATVGAGPGDLALRLAAGSFRDGTRVAGTAVDLQRAMIEANGPAVLTLLSEAVDRLTAARDELRDSGTVHTLVQDGHRARARWDAMRAADAEPIVDVAIGSDGWAAELRRQAHLGRVWTGPGQTRRDSPG
jgi:prephenate dehydrogenase